MSVKRLVNGNKLTVFTWLDADRSQFEEFFADPHTGRDLSVRTIALITRAANEGPPENDEQCRLADPVRDGDLYIFLIYGGLGVLWFYSEDGIIICLATRMMKTGKIRESDLETALNIKRLYFEERSHDDPLKFR